MKSNYYRFVGSQLRQYRKNNQMSLEEVAVKIGVTKKTVSNYETATTKIHPETLKQLLIIYGIDVQSFMNTANQHI